MALADEPFEVNILPSAVMDIVRGRYFYDQFELGFGQMGEGQPQTIQS